MIVGDVVEMNGWLVIVDYKLYLIPNNYSENYEGGEKVEINGPELIFYVADKVLPLGGGKSFIFHRAKISGLVIKVSPLKVMLSALSVEERGKGFIAIDLQTDESEKFKKQYDTFLKGRGVNSTDWLDYLG